MPQANQDKQALFLATSSFLDTTLLATRPEKEMQARNGCAVQPTNNAMSFLNFYKMW